MSRLERGGMCHGGGFFYSQLNPDVNHAVAGFPDDGSADGFLRFAGPEDGGVGWLLNGAKAAELSAHERMPSLVAPPIKSSDWLSSSCSSRPAVPGGCWSTESLPETTSMSLPADVPMAGRAASLGTAIAYSGASFAGNSPTSSFATAEKATSSGKCEGTTSEREARVMRYREKRKRRRFEKQIRYASRKAYADTRPRIRGRFAKTPEEKQPPSPAPLNVSAQNGMGWFRS